MAQLAHRADCDLPEHLRERLRNCGLYYELVEASEPRVIKTPPLVPRKPVLRLVAVDKHRSGLPVASNDWLRDVCVLVTTQVRGIR